MSSNLLICPSCSPPEIAWRNFPREVVVRCFHWLSEFGLVDLCDSSPSGLVDVWVWPPSNPGAGLLGESSPVVVVFRLDVFVSRGRIAVLRSLEGVFDGNESGPAALGVVSLVLVEVVAACLDVEASDCCV